MRVNYGQSVHGEEEIEAVVNVLRTSTQMGKNVKKFEETVAEIFAKKYGLMVNSGSSALYLAIESLGLPIGSEVITPILTFSTTVGSIIKNGLKPVFVDVEENTFCIDVSKLESALTSKTKAVMIPNLLGNVPDWSEIRAFCDKNDLIAIEDSADTIGATLFGKRTGEFSDISICSFYGSHVVNCAGNGGILCSNSESLMRKARLLRSWGRSSSVFVESSEAIENRFETAIDGIEYDAKFLFEEIGYNLEPSELGAAFGLVQLNKLAINLNKRSENFRMHSEFFSQHCDWISLPYQRPEVFTGWLAFPIVIRDNAPFTRRELQVFLEKADIQTRVIFTGNILRQPGFRAASNQDPNDFPVADSVMKGGILIGCHQGLNMEHLAYTHEVFGSFFKKYR